MIFSTCILLLLLSYFVRIKDSLPIVRAHIILFLWKLYTALTSFHSTAVDQSTEIISHLNYNQMDFPTHFALVLCMAFYYFLSSFRSACTQPRTHDTHTQSVTREAQSNSVCVCVWTMETPFCSYRKIFRLMSCGSNRIHVTALCNQETKIQ